MKGTRLLSDTVSTSQDIELKVAHTNLYLYKIKVSHIKCT